VRLAVARLVISAEGVVASVRRAGAGGNPGRRGLVLLAVTGLVVLAEELPAPAERADRTVGDVVTVRGAASGRVAEAKPRVAAGDRAGFPVVAALPLSAEFKPVPVLALGAALVISASRGEGDSAIRAGAVLVDTSRDIPRRDFPAALVPLVRRAVARPVVLPERLLASVSGADGCGLALRAAVRAAPPGGVARGEGVTAVAALAIRVNAA